MGNSGKNGAAELFPMSLQRRDAAVTAFRSIHARASSGGALGKTGDKNSWENMLRQVQHAEAGAAC
jgi:hypothetical protein